MGKVCIVCGLENGEHKRNCPIDQAEEFLIITDGNTGLELDKP